MGGARSVAQRVGLLDRLERRRDVRSLFWLRSLFAIWNVEDMIRLDVPWWTFAATERVERYLAAIPRARVFEYGAGASTVWLAKRAGSVCFVEHDAAWMRTLAPFVERLPNVSGLLRVPTPAAAPAFASHKSGWRGLDFTDYVRAIDEVGGAFDLIVVDGRCRPACLERGLAHLADEAVLVYDNSGRRRYRAAIDNSGLPRIETFGLTPTLPYPDRTTLLLRGERARLAAGTGRQ
jgi:hypothetical protein